MKPGYHLKENIFLFMTEICKNYKNILIVADENTFSAAGTKVENALSGKTVKKVIFSGETVLIPNEEAIEKVNANICDTDLIIGIGSGVIQDLCKYVSFFSKIPYMVVATAPSMDGYASDGAAIEYDEMTGEVKKIRTRKTGAEKKKGFNAPQAIVIEKAVISDNITVKELSEKIGKTGAEIIKKLFLLGIIKTINDSIDFDTASLVSSELGVELELQHTETSEEKLLALHEDVEQEDSANLVTRPPIVTIMGHVA